MSSRLLCEPCSFERQNATARQLVAGEGPHYDRWLASYVDTARRLASR